MRPRFVAAVALLLALAVGALAATPAAMAAPAPRLQPVPSRASTPSVGHGTAAGRALGHARAVCDGRATHCTALVATDSNGKPLVFARPRTGGPAAGSGAVGYSPQQFHSAYSFPWYSGVRQTVAVIDAYDHPNVKGDLDTYDSTWGLGYFPYCSSTVTTACFQRVDQNGSASGFVNSSAAGAAAWSLETNLDVQLAHAMCLNCKILLVEAYNESGLAAANNTAARLGATEISNSWGYLEGTFSTWNPSAFIHPGIAITASAHDHGYGAYYPADLNSVIAVGGTNLRLNTDNSYNSETVWGNGTVAPSGWGTGSGCSGFNSTYTTATGWQTAVPLWSYTGCGSRRSIADVAIDADPNTGAYVYDSVPNSNGQYGWFIEGGTSLSAPMIASGFALAGNAATTSWPAQLMYARTSYFRDVTAGSNGTCGYYIECHAWSGYDGPTGVGNSAWRGRPLTRGHENNAGTERRAPGARRSCVPGVVQTTTWMPSRRGSLEGQCGCLDHLPEVHAMSFSYSSTHLRRTGITGVAAAVTILAGGIQAAHADVNPPLPSVPPPVLGSGAPPLSAPGLSAAPSAAPTTTPPATSTPSTTGPARDGVVSVHVVGRIAVVRLRCADSGTLTVTDRGGRRIGHARFTCRRGHAVSRVHVPRRFAHARRLKLRATVQGANGTSTDTARSSSAHARAADAGTQTLCEYDEAAGIQYCYEYWFNSWGPAKYQGYWIFGGQEHVYLSGQYQGTAQFWFYYTNSGWVQYSSYWL